MFNMYGWKPYIPEQIPDNLVLMENEPRVTFADPNKTEVLVLTSSGLFFNRDAFPHDSYRTAAKRAFAVIDNTMREYLTDNKRSFNFRLKEWKEFPVRQFEIACDGTITHNYDNIDTWHWWFLQALGKLVREKYYT